MPSLVFVRVAAHARRFSARLYDETAVITTHRRSHHGDNFRILTDMTETALQYQIQASNPAAHIFEVSLTIPNPDAAGQQLVMPAWIPGSYMIRDYARNVVSITARCGEQAIGIAKRDKSSWQAEPCDGTLTVTIEVFAHDPSVRGAHLDVTHGFFNGTCMFLEPVGLSDAPCQLQILPPADGQDWQVATSMRRDGAELWGFGSYRADNYADLVDHPVELGKQVIREFVASDVPHALAIRGHIRGDVDRLVADLKTICEQHVALLGVPSDLDRYLFLLNMPASGYGGLEHGWSSANISSRDSLPVRGSDETHEGYRTLLGLLSHEYFHLWNVKRMKPARFRPYKLDGESYTELLWVFEGITSYYDDLALRRSGLIDDNSYLELLGRTITRVLRGSGRLRQSVAESSFDAWTKFYKQDANAQNAIVSYYAKGAMIALALDLTLRSESSSSLDEVMRECWRRYGETGEGLPERGFESVCREVSGLALDDFFDRYVYGTEDPPLKPLLANLGVQLHERSSSGLNDKGGKSAASPATTWLGATLADDNGRTTVRSVANGSPAERAGIGPGDQLLALDGLRISAATLDRRLLDFVDGDVVMASLFRDDVIVETAVTLESPPQTTVWLSLDADNEAVVKKRMLWFGDENASA
ncbi:MAG: PDZ domain-containing protein [Pseudomonadota bacterium]